MIYEKMYAYIKDMTIEQFQEEVKNNTIVENLMNNRKYGKYKALHNRDH